MVAYVDICAACCLMIWLCKPLCSVSLFQLLVLMDFPNTEIAVSGNVSILGTHNGELFAGLQLVQHSHRLIFYLVIFVPMAVASASPLHLGNQQSKSYSGIRLLWGPHRGYARSNVGRKGYCIPAMYGKKCNAKTPPIGNLLERLGSHFGLRALQSGDNRN